VRIELGSAGRTVKSVLAEGLSATAALIEDVLLDEVNTAGGADVILLPLKLCGSPFLWRLPLIAGVMRYIFQFLPSCRVEKKGK